MKRPAKPVLADVPENGDKISGGCRFKEEVFCTKIASEVFMLVRAREHDDRQTAMGRMRTKPFQDVCATALRHGHIEEESAGKGENVAVLVRCVAFEIVNDLKAAGHDSKLMRESCFCEGAFEKGDIVRVILRNQDGSG